ncbi:hypothetical protein N436_05005, partial [Pseudomonas sp. RV120224-01b]
GLPAMGRTAAPKWARLLDKPHLAVDLLDHRPLAFIEARLVLLEQVVALGIDREETVFRAAYRYCHGNQLQTGRLLNISRNIVRARLEKIGELSKA